MGQKQTSDIEHAKEHVMEKLYSKVDNIDWDIQE